MSGTRTVTFLFTDIEGSTRLWDESADTMGPALARHDALLRAAIAERGGETFKTVGDAFCAVFDDAPAAVAATLAAQRALAEEPWATPRPLRVRMALHTGTAEARDGDYFGPPLNRVARLLATGHGGQTLLSGATYELVRDALPEGAFLVSLGEHRLKDLARPEAVYGLRHPALPAEFPPLRSLDSAALPNNLPEQTTSFIGRADELVEVAAKLTTTRLLTLVGPGGTGKTRLALQAAAEAIDAFPGGAWLVELAALENPALVPSVVAGALGVAEEAGKPLAQALAERLRRAPTLLLLDNCEHLLDAAARLADALLRAVPTLRVLATSREPLGVGGETVHRVPTLSLPKRTAAHTVESLSHFEAVRLFVERATAQKADFAVTNANAPALASLCLQLDGIPLAIELAAARVRALTVEQIDARLDDRFRLLTGGSRTALPRQQTLRALVEWSHDLLNDAERAVFRRVAAFAGGWTLEAAEAVAAGEGVEEGEALDLLASLVDKSLVGTEEAEGAVRYGMLETVRHFAGERLREGGEEGATFARHVAFFAALAATEGPRCAASGEPLRPLTADWDNLRAAADRGTAAQRLELVGALVYFWNAKGAFQEGLQRSEAALRDDEPPSLDARRCAALWAAGWFALQVGELSTSIAWSEKALALARELADQAVEMRALNTLGTAAWFATDLARSRAIFEAAARLQDREAIWSNLAGVLLGAGDYDAAAAALDRCAAILKDRPNDYSLAFYHLRRGRLAYLLGKLDEAASEFERAQELAAGIGAAEAVVGAKIDRCDCRRAQGRLEEALATVCEALAETTSADTLRSATIVRTRCALALGRIAEAEAAILEYLRSSSLLTLPEAIETVVALLAATGRPREAALLLGATTRERRRRPQPVPPVDLPEHDRRVAHLREALGDDAFARATAEGERTDLAAAEAFARATLTPRPYSLR